MAILLRPGDEYRVAVVLDLDPQVLKSRRDRGILHQFVLFALLLHTQKSVGCGGQVCGCLSVFPYVCGGGGAGRGTRGFGLGGCAWGVKVWL